MRTLIVTMALSGAALSACGIGSDNPKKLEAKAEKIESQTAKTLEAKDIGGVIDYFDVEAKQITLVLQSVTDGPSAEAAVDEIRAVIPRLNASLDALADQDMSSVKDSMAAMSKMPALMETQAELMKELGRISQIPEARDVIEAEFDKLDILK